MKYRLTIKRVINGWLITHLNGALSVATRVEEVMKSINNAVEADLLLMKNGDTMVANVSIEHNPPPSDK